MIKFFRKIRFNLIGTKETGKYFKYAIGEIILVVIGILIALQVNNWNENRIEHNRIKKYAKSEHSHEKNKNSFNLLELVCNSRDNRRAS